MRDAATVLLMLECEGGLEVLMMRRGATLSFMAGMWVFPGGRMDDADRSPAALARVLPADLEHVAGGLRGLLGERLPPATAAGLRIAVCREAFEEAGLLESVSKEVNRAPSPSAAKVWVIR